MQVAGKFKASSGKTLWRGAREEGRRVYVLPYGDERFLAFGIHTPSGDVTFVVTGSIDREMDAFIEQMKGAGVEVVVVPLPIETQEIEPPPGPGVQGYFREKATKSTAKTKAKTQKPRATSKRRRS